MLVQVHVHIYVPDWWKFQTDLSSSRSHRSSPKSSPPWRCMMNMHPWRKRAGSQLAMIGRFRGFCCKFAIIDAGWPPQYVLVKYGEVLVVNQHYILAPKKNKTTYRYWVNSCYRQYDHWLKSSKSHSSNNLFSLQEWTMVGSGNE